MKSSFHDLSNRSIANLKQACKTTAHPHGNLSLEFPNKLYNQVTQLQAKDHIVFILRTLKNVMRLYHGKYEKADCDQKKLQIFILDIHRQIAELERCETEIVVSEVNKKITKKMEMHFKSLISHLKHTEYSANGWKDVAGMILQHISRLDVLAINTKQDLSL
ncbi:interferon a3-like [Astyanax mexicanus]|uniref:interferon a3-like n=1 Tax=Astyanax mexicanus TaxID=7994 RepID=UPI0020CB129C|nr:interferon a3-like [Astyanax mexicanus]